MNSLDLVTEHKMVTADAVTIDLTINGQAITVEVRLQKISGVLEITADTTKDGENAPGTFTIDDASDSTVVVLHPATL